MKKTPMVEIDPEQHLALKALKSQREQEGVPFKECSIRALVHKALEAFLAAELSKKKSRRA